MKDQNLRHYYPWPTPPIIGIRVDTREGNGAPRGDAHIWTVKMGQMTQETGKRPNGAAAAILAVPFPRVDTNAYIKGGCLRRFRCTHLDRQNGTNDSRDGEAAQRRGGGDTRRSLTAYRHECKYKGGLSAAVLPPPTLRTSLFARHSRRFTTQNSLFILLVTQVIGAPAGGI